MNSPDTPSTTAWDRWTTFTTWLTMLMAISLPLEQMVYHAALTHPVLFGIRWLGTVVFAIDFLWRFRRRDYARHSRQRGWLIPDILAALPSGAVLYVTFPDSPGWLLVIAHLLPMVRLARIYVLARAWQQDNPASTGLRRILSTVVFIALATHWIGCWQMAVYEQDPADPLALRYLQAIYWTLTTMTTIGYGDITPDKQQAGQLLFSMLIMVIGAGAFGFIIGNVANIMSSLDFARNQHLEKLQRANAFLRYNQIPRRLQKQIHNYYAYLWETRRGFDEIDVLSELPPAIRLDVEMHLRRDIVAKVPFFRGADANMIRALVALLRPRIALPDEVIIRKGEIGDSMFFIASGEVQVLGPDGETSVATLTEGAFFGEIALIEACPRGADVRAKSYCDLYTLDKSSLDSVIETYPDFGRHIRTMAQQRKGQPPGNR